MRSGSPAHFCFRVALIAGLLASVTPSLRGQLTSSPSPPRFSKIISTNNQQTLSWTLFPAANAYVILSSTNLATPFLTNSGGAFAGNQWSITNPAPFAFYQLQVSPMSSNDLLTAIVLNRLAYGQTPDELDRLGQIGPQAFIDEQLNPETISETVDATHTNLANIFGKFTFETNVIDLKRTYSYTTNATNSALVTTNLAISSTNATLSDLRAWHTLRAVGARRQFLEILLQFLENHFVTQYTKTSTYLNGFYNGDAGIMEDRVASQLEYLENNRWRAALLNPQCTFYDLLRISAESPAMIIYLDSVTSKGSGTQIANENYARELMELFTMGVDNGYDQNDITILSRCWTGWTVELVDPTNAFNPFASRTTTVMPGITNNVSATTNLMGSWAFNFKQGNHNTNSKSIFFTNGIAKTVPTRFGPPWAGRSYGLLIPSRLGTNGIQDGYAVLAHLANLPFTAEYISVKLCRLLVHDGFAHGYDFQNDNSAEAKLVHDCMLAWESGGGQVRPVLSVILNSGLFRSHGAAIQKVKTPLEFAVSAVRALRASTNSTGLAGTFTGDTDGYSFSTALNRMGGMALFDRNDPNGYPEDAAGWISGGTLTERIRFAQSFCIARGQPGHGGTTNDAGNCVSDPVALLKFKLPASSWTNATLVSDYFVKIFYPGEGLGNLNLYRDAAVRFLNDGSADQPSATTTPFGSVSAAIYDARVRGMVAMLLGFPRFQEQ